MCFGYRRIQSFKLRIEQVAIYDDDDDDLNTKDLLPHPAI